MKIIHLFIIVSLLTGCKNEESLSIQKSLDEAKTNRTEIQKALDFFPEKSKEYNAMRFLVKNMIYHNSFDGNANDRLKEIMDTATRFDFNKIEWDFLSKVREPKLQSDLVSINADYLIDNVLEACKTWSECPWKEEIGFQHFCEYVLPYKIANEPIVKWRNYYKEKYGFLIEGITNQREAFFRVYSYIHSRYKGPKFDYPYEQDALLLDMAGGGHCKERAYHMVYVMRALGISVSLDYTPVWSNYGENAHIWVALVENNDSIAIPSLINNQFYIDTALESMEYAVPNDYHYKVDSLKKVAKVLRRSFRARKENIDKNPFYRPKAFKDVTVHDVTLSYPTISKSSIIDVDKFTDKSALYTCTYTHKHDWYPIGMAKAISNHRVDVGPLVNENVVMIAEYTNGNIIPRSQPCIIYNSGKIHKLIPDTINKQCLRIYRKYVFSSRWINRWGEIIGSSIETSSSATFEDKECLFHWNQMPYEVTRIKLDKKKLRRYLRFYPKKYHYPTLAEIHLRDSSGNEISHSDYQIFAIGDGLTGDSLVVRSLQDNDEKTTFFKQFPFWIGIDLKNNIQATNELEIIMRNDENRIKPGNEYELLYFDREWVSLGKKIAQNDYLEYCNAPTNAIFLIKNHTEGAEERIFTYENGVQIWW